LVGISISETRKKGNKNETYPYHVNINSLCYNLVSIAARQKSGEGSIQVGGVSRTLRRDFQGLCPGKVDTLVDLGSLGDRRLTVKVCSKNCVS